MSARDELAGAVVTAFLNADEMVHIGTARAAADSILAAGYSKPRTITTPAEANALPDRAAFVTPGEIIFRKWENYYSEGKHAWERELGQMVPAELLSAEGHFPATVLYTPKES